jgi:Fe-S-cluster containining protein
MSDADTFSEQSDLSRLASERFSQLADTAFQRYDRELERGAPTSVACKPGCSYCCRSLVVTVSLPEVFLLKFHVDSLPPAERAALRQRIAAGYALSLDHSAHERLHSHEGCPLLINDQCSLYEYRPLSCRAAASLDAEACRRSFEGEKVKISMPRIHMDALRETTLMLLATMSAAGIDCKAYELNMALHIALTEPDVERRWLEGEPLFAAAEMR